MGHVFLDVLQVKHMEKKSYKFEPQMKCGIRTIAFYVTQSVSALNAPHSGH